MATQGGPGRSQGDTVAGDRSQDIWISSCQLDGTVASQEALHYSTQHNDHLEYGHREDEAVVDQEIASDRALTNTDPSSTPRVIGTSQGLQAQDIREQRRVRSAGPWLRRATSGLGDEELSANSNIALTYDDRLSAMSEPLPADDGMRGLRQKLHAIREMALSTDEKARRMHDLMVEDYRMLKIRQGGVTAGFSPNQHVSTEERKLWTARSSPASSESGFPIDVSLDSTDLEPTYYPHSYHRGVQTDIGEEEDDSDEGDLHIPLGCTHYMRNVKVQCADCGRWYTCRHCHDEKESHKLVRRDVRNMLCMRCGQPQRAAEYCSQCEEQTSCYYCDICKLWDNDASKTIYHCPDCGICRRGEGLGKDFMHCLKCNVCVSIQHAEDHRCVERATDCDCPICGDYMFASASTVVAMKCGHYIHRSCYDDLMNTTYKCPICSRSAVNMELQWRKMDDCIESQPMPSQYKDTQALIVCNDCTLRSCVPFHWLGNKCRLCDSYNTNQLNLVNEPRETVETSADIEAQQHEVARAAGIPHPGGDLLNGLTTRTLADDASFAAGQSHAYPVSPQAAFAQSVDVEEGGNNPVRRSRPDSFSNDMNAPSTVAPSPPPLDLNHSSPELHRHSHSNSSASIPNLSEAEEEAGFWGEGINPGDYMPSLPQMPSMPTMPAMPAMPRMPSVSMPSIPSGWRSPRLFARRDYEQDLERRESVTSWRFSPSQWRLSSPTGFWRSEVGRAEAALSDEDLTLPSESSADKGYGLGSRFGWDPRQWRLPHSPRLFGEQDAATEDTISARGTSPDSGSVWPIDPRQWRFGSPQIFGRPKSADDAVFETASGVKDSTAPSPSSLWNMHPRSFLARRFGSFSIPGASDQDQSEDELSGSEDDEESEQMTDEDNDENEEEEDSIGRRNRKWEEVREDEMDLIGHR